MATIVRFFGPTSAGAGDGTTWADRAALHTAGVWSTIITGFSFVSDSLECRIGPGTYTITAELGALSTTSTNRCLLIGCDSSGNRLSIPDKSWVSSMPKYDDSAFPVLQITTNARILNSGVICRFMKFIGTGNTTASLIAVVRELSWCTVFSSGLGGSTTLAVNVQNISNCVIKCTLTSFAGAVTAGVNGILFNNRISGDGTGSLGARAGVFLATTNGVPRWFNNCIFNFIGDGFNLGNSAAGFTAAITGEIANNTITNCATGINILTTQAPTAASSCIIENNYIANCSGNGISATFDFITLNNNRIRDCASGALNGVTLDFDTYTVDSDDSTEFVNAAIGDYRIKSTALAVWGKKYGAGDEPSSGSTVGTPSAYFI